jgi:hypothetical protein
MGARAGVWWLVLMMSSQAWAQAAPPAPMPRRFAVDAGLEVQYLDLTGPSDATAGGWIAATLAVGDPRLRVGVRAAIQGAPAIEKDGGTTIMMVGAGAHWRGCARSVVCASIGVEAALARIVLDAPNGDEGEESRLRVLLGLPLQLRLGGEAAFVIAAGPRLRLGDDFETPFGDARRLGAYVGIGMAVGGQPSP